MKKLKAIAAEHAVDVLAVAGGGCITYGVGLMYAPAGWITGGVLLIVAAFVGTRR